MTIPLAYTVASLAERWGTSDTFVYDQIKAGRLRAFRLGGKLIRIRPDAVDEYEKAGEIETAAGCATATIPQDDTRPSDATLARLLRLSHKPL